MAAGDPPAAAGDVSPVTSLYQSLILSVVSLREALSALSQVIDQFATRQPLLETPVLPDPPKPSPPPTQSFDSDDITASDAAAAAAVSEVLDSAAAAVAEAADGSDGGEAPRLDAAARASEELLSEVHAFLSCPSSNQVGPFHFVGLSWSGVPWSEFLDGSWQ
jgi:hypothetical protein